MYKTLSKLCWADCMAKTLMWCGVGQSEHNDDICQSICVSVRITVGNLPTFAPQLLILSFQTKYTKFALSSMILLKNCTVSVVIHLNKAKCGMETSTCQ